MSTARQATLTAQALVVALLGGLLALALIAVVATLGGGSAAYVIAFAVLAVLEAFAAYHLRRTHPYAPLTAARYRVVELAVFFVLMQLAADLAAGRPIVTNGTPALSGAAFGWFLAVGALWALAGETARDLDQAGDPTVYDPRYVGSEHRLWARFLLGGALLFLATGLTDARIAAQLHAAGRQSLSPVILFLYLIAGLGLLAQVRYAVLRLRWRHRAITPSGGLAAAWVRYGLVLLAVGAMLAVVFPTGAGSGIAVAVRLLLEGVFTAAAVLFTLISAPLIWLFAHLGITPPHHTLPAAPHRPPPHLPRTNTRSHPADLGTLLKTLLFWLAAAAGVVFLIRLLRHTHLRGGRLGAVRLSLSGWWHSLWRALRASRRYAALVPHLPGGRSVTPPAPVRRLLRAVRRPLLSPRDRVLWYYGALLYRARRRGVRRRGQTPDELDAALERLAPDVAPDVHALTALFVRARYSRHEVAEQEAHAARDHWQRIRAGLRAESAASPAAAPETRA